jgi:saccharopine dehydrogenase-like NADP-dependent oxidoreductase
MQSAEFIADLAFLIEVVKSTLHRELDIHHPVQDIIAKVCKVQTTKNGEKVTHLNYKNILNQVEEDQIDIIFEPE